MGAGAPATRDWRQDVVGASGIVVLLGLWLVFSPLLLGYGSEDASWNPVACGVLGIVVGLGGAIRRARTTVPGWLLMAIGVWLFASSFWLAESSQASWNARGGGALMFFLGSVSVIATQRPMRV